MLMCLICFVLGYLFARMMRGNGLSVGGVIGPILNPCNWDTGPDSDELETWTHAIIRTQDQCSSDKCFQDVEDCRLTCNRAACKASGVPLPLPYDNLQKTE